MPSPGTSADDVDAAQGAIRAVGTSYSNTRATDATDMDILVVKVDGTTGQVIWGEQFGGAGDEVCESVAVDNNGDVIIAGNFNGTLSFGGSTTSLTGPTANGADAILFVAKLQSADGKPLLARAFGTSSTSGHSDALALGVDGLKADGTAITNPTDSGNIIVAGALGATTAFDSHSIDNLGLTDAFVVKFDKNIGTLWAKSFGDSGYDQGVKTLGIGANGDVFVGGAFKGTLGELGGFGRSSSYYTSFDAWSAQLASADGAPQCSHAYGDAGGSQSISAIAVARTSTNAVMMGGSFSSEITLGSVTLNTGSTSNSWSFITNITP